MGVICYKFPFKLHIGQFLLVIHSVFTLCIFENSFLKRIQVSDYIFLVNIFYVLILFCFFVFFANNAFCLKGYLI